ncbi:hypothetical protein QFZ85_000201 [Pseudomonas frederiksbergensis]
MAARASLAESIRILSPPTKAHRSSVVVEFAIYSRIGERRLTPQGVWGGRLHYKNRWSVFNATQQAWDYFCERVRKATGETKK